MTGLASSANPGSELPVRATQSAAPSTPTPPDARSLFQRACLDDDAASVRIARDEAGA